MKDRTVAVGTATVKMAVTAPDRTAVYSMEMAKATTEATEAATDEPACRRGTGARTATVRRVRADARQASRADIALAGGTGRGSPASHRSSVVLIMN